MSENFYQKTTAEPSSSFDISLRPPVFSEFIGQDKVTLEFDLSAGELFADGAPRSGDLAKAFGSLIEGAIA